MAQKSSHAAAEVSRFFFSQEQLEKISRLEKEHEEARSDIKVEFVLECCLFRGLLIYLVDSVP